MGFATGAGRQGPYADAIRGQLPPQRVHEGLHRVLAGAVYRLAVKVMMTGNRTGDDDISASLGLHLWDDGVGAAQNGIDIDFEHSRENIKVAVRELAADPDAGIGQQDINATKMRLRPPYHFLNI